MGGSKPPPEPRVPVFPEGKPRRVAQVGAAVGDMSEQERVEGQKGLSLVGEPSERYVKGEPLGWSDVQRLQAIVVTAAFWDEVDSMEEAMPERQETRGRPREHTLADWLFASKAEALYGSVRGALRQIHDPQIMAWVHLALPRAWPGRPERRLSHRPISRSQFSYFESHCVTPEMRAAQMDQLLKSACAAALQIGLFNPLAGTLTDPDKTHSVTGDGAWLRTKTEVHKPTEWNKSKYDPDAVPYHLADNRPARGHLFVKSSARNPHRQERVIFAAQVKPKGVTEDDLFSEHIARILEHSPEIAKGLFAAVYDGAMDSETQDRLFALGVIPHNPVRVTKGGKPGAMNLGPHDFIRTDGIKQSLGVTAVAGSAVIVCTDGTGDDWYVPLNLKQINRTRPKGSKRYYPYWEGEIPDNDVVPEGLVGARTRIGLSSTAEEAESRPHRRRTRYLRAWAPDSSETARNLSGLRQDSESGISHYKQSTPLDRTRFTNAARLQLDLLAHLHNNNTTAIVAHHKRTGADITDWFGQYNPLDPYDLVRSLVPHVIARSLDPQGELNPLELYQLIRNLDPEQLKPGKQKPGKQKPGKQKPGKQKPGKQKPQAA